jgi:hypothetical protein
MKNFMKGNAFNPKMLKGLPTSLVSNPEWLRGVDLNHRPLGYEGKSTSNDIQSLPYQTHKAYVKRARELSVFGWFVTHLTDRRRTEQRPPSSLGRSIPHLPDGT